MLRSTHVNIHFSHLQANMKTLQSRIKKTAKTLPMIKANAYGHDIKIMARLLEKIGIDQVGVADFIEAIDLRKSGYKKTIMVFGALDPYSLKELFDPNMICVIHNPDELMFVLKSKSKWIKKLRFHIELNTGMNRQGFDTQDVKSFEIISKAKLNVEGVFTHLSQSDLQNDPFTKRQLNMFDETSNLMAHLLNKKLMRHALNSAGVLNHPCKNHDWIRPGISIYGYAPKTHQSLFQPILEWKSKVIEVKTISKGQTVGYDRVFRAKKKMKIATIGLGYGDGYLRQYQNCSLKYKNTLLPIVGKICMDMLMVDASLSPHIKVLDEITVLEAKADSPLNANAYAKMAKTIPYEILTLISSRVPRFCV